MITIVLLNDATTLHTTITTTIMMSFYDVISHSMTLSLTSSRWRRKLTLSHSSIMHRAKKTPN